MKKIELYLPLLVLTLLMEACASVDDAPTAVVAPLAYPVPPPATTAPPVYRFCSGPRWSDECDFVFFLRPEERITGLGHFGDPILGLRYGQFPAPVPNFLGWVQQRAHANEWRRAYVLPFTLLTGQMYMFCSRSLPENFQSNYWTWPLDNGSQLEMVIEYTNTPGGRCGIDSVVNRLAFHAITPDGRYTRHDEIFSKASFTYTITSAHYALHEVGVDPENIFVSTLSPIVDRDYLVWF